MRSIRSRTVASTLVAVMALGGAAPARAASPDEIEQKLKALEDEVRALRRQLEQQSKTTPPPTAAPVAAPATTPPPGGTPPTGVAGAPPPPVSPTGMMTLPEGTRPSTPGKEMFGLFPSPIEGIRMGMYGEFKFGTMQNPNAQGHWQNGFDAQRIVLLPTFQFTDSIIFNGEIEFEHGGIAFDNDDKSHGAVEIEQAYIDFRISPYLNIRSPGIDLIPVGYINLHHEPTLFYSVNRPEIANGLVPTTWFAPAAGVYGKVVDGLNYQFQISTSLEDFGDSFDNRSEGKRVPPIGTPYEAGINGHEALALAKSPTGDFSQLSNDIAYAARLSYDPSFLPGFAGSTSVYFTPNTTPRGAHSDLGTTLGRSNLTLFDTEFRYRIPETGWEFRGEYARAFIGNPANLRANNDSDPENNVGRAMYGISGEVAYHQRLGSFLGSEWWAVPFYRYTYENFQMGGFHGTDSNNPTGSGQMQFHTVGAAVYPTPKLVLKLNYQKVLDNTSAGARSDSVLGAVGFYFY
jgi:hypothetical protein